MDFMLIAQAVCGRLKAESFCVQAQDINEDVRNKEIVIINEIFDSDFN